MSMSKCGAISMTVPIAVTPRLDRSTLELRDFARHAPPPGLAFGEPDDRLQRGIQHAAAVRFHHKHSGILGRPVNPGDDDCECCVRGALLDFRFKRSGTRHPPSRSIM